MPTKKYPLTMTVRIPADLIEPLNYLAGMAMYGDRSTVLRAALRAFVATEEGRLQAELETAKTRIFSVARSNVPQNT